MAANSSSHDAGAAGSGRGPSDGQSCYFLGFMRHPPERVVLRNVRQHNLKASPSSSAAGALGHYRPSGSGKARSRSTALRRRPAPLHRIPLDVRQAVPRAMPKPLVDAMEGLSLPSPSSRKTPRPRGRSTVGTATEIADFCDCCGRGPGTQVCLQCGRDVKRTRYRKWWTP